MPASGVTPFSFVSDDSVRHTKGPLGLLARVALSAGGSPGLASLPMQFSNEVLELAKFLSIRGESHLEHYYGEAIALACLRPENADIRRYELLLLSLIRFDRRQPLLPTAEQIAPLRLAEQHCINFIQQLRIQSSFQTIYEVASQLETYGAMSRSAKKMERIILLSREMTGQPLLGAISPHEQMVLDLAVSRQVA